MLFEVHPPLNEIEDASSRAVARLRQHVEQAGTTVTRSRALIADSRRLLASTRVAPRSIGVMLPADDTDVAL